MHTLVKFKWCYTGATVNLVKLADLDVGRYACSFLKLCLSSSWGTTASPESLFHSVKTAGDRVMNGACSSDKFYVESYRKQCVLRKYYEKSQEKTAGKKFVLWGVFIQLISLVGFLRKKNVRENNLVQSAITAMKVRKLQMNEWFLGEWSVSSVWQCAHVTSNTMSSSQITPTHLHCYCSDSLKLPQY